MTGCVQFLRRGDRSPPRGLAITELVVAATLLITAISLVVTVSFRTGRVWQDSRHYQLAVEQVHNELERLTAFDASKIDAELTRLTVSDQIQAALPNPHLAGRKISDEFGDRVEVSLSWERLGSAQTVSLVGWLALPGRKNHEAFARIYFGGNAGSDLGGKYFAGACGNFAPPHVAAR